MTLITIETTDPRDRKALELAATAATWKPAMNGAFLVPSSDGRRTYVTTADTCSCEDNARGNRCKHRRAAAIYLALREAGQPTPVRKPVEAPTPIDRHSPELRRILGGPAPYRTDHRLCHAPGTRGRECAEHLGHAGPHSFVPQTQRES